MMTGRGSSVGAETLLNSSAVFQRIAADSHVAVKRRRQPIIAAAFKSRASARSTTVRDIWRTDRARFELNECPLSSIRCTPQCQGSIDHLPGRNTGDVV